MQLKPWLLILGVPCIALPARAQRDLAGCKTVSDANLKTTVTPHHGYSTQTQGGKARTSESIVANGKNYFQYEGHWRASPMTIADVLALQKQNIDSATAYTCKAASGGLYHVHQQNSDGVKYDSDVWVANGLVVHIEQDMDMGDATGKVHLSTKYEYANIAAPPGV